MADESRAPGDEAKLDAQAGFTGKRACDQQRRAGLARVERQRGQRDILAPGAQHVGRADIARADGANIAQAGKPGQQQPERNRAQQIAAERGVDKIENQHSACL